MASVVPRVFRVGGLFLLVVACLAQADAFFATDGPNTYHARDTVDGGPPTLFSTLSPGSGWTCGAISIGGTYSVNNVLPAGFSFPFYGVSQTYARMYRYGYLTFGTGISASSFASNIPSFSTPNNAIFGHHENTYVTLSPDRTCYKSTGTGSDQVAYMLWENMPHSSWSTYRTNFVMILWEADGVIEVHYGNDVSDPDGTFESAGIENSAGNVGVNYAYSSTFSGTGKAIQYRPTTVFPTANPDSYNLDYDLGGATLMVDGLPHGAQPAWPKVLTNDAAVHNVPFSNAVQLTAITPATGATITTMSGGACTATAGISADGSFCFTANACRDYTLTYRADDTFPNDGVAPFTDQATITVKAYNLPGCPKARNDPHNVAPATSSTMYQSTEDLPLSILAAYPPGGAPYASCTLTSGILCNDDDSNPGQTATLLVDTASYGTSNLAGTLAGIDASNTLAKGAFLYTPTSDACGTKSFTYRAIDTSLDYSNVATAYIHVVCAHDAPTALPDAYTANEGATLTVATGCAAVADLLCNDLDPDTNDSDTVITAGIKDATGPTDKVMVCTQPAHGTVTISAAQETTGGFTYTPGPGLDQQWYGVQTFTYKVRDGRTDQTVDSPCATVTLTINNIADAPVAVADAFTSVPNLGWTDVVAPGVLANDYDYDNIAPTPAYAGLQASLWTGLSCPGASGHSMANFAAAGSFTFNPPTSPANWVGTCSFQYRVYDGAAYSGIVTATIQVVAPTAPFAANDLCAVNEDASVTTPVVSPACPHLATNDLKFATAASFVLVTPPAAMEGTVTVTPTGGYTFTPVANFNGVATFTYRFSQVDPGTGNPVTSNTATARITVASVNDAPAGTPKAYATNEDVTLFVSNSCLGLVKGLLCEAAGYDADPSDSPDNTPITVNVPALPLATGKGRVTAMATSGSFTYVPSPHAHGTDTFTYQVRDSLNGLSAPITVTVVISPLPDNPVSLPDACTPVFTTPFASYIPTCPASPGQQAYTAWYGHTLVVEPPTGGLLANDYDPDTYPTVPLMGIGLTADCAGTCTLSPNLGALTVRPTGGFTYIPPAAGSCTNLQFSYRAKDSTNALGPLANAKIRVCPNNVPVANFTITGPTTVDIGTVVTFQDASSDLDLTPLSYEWTFGDGVTSSAMHATHAYERAGVYTVRLRVTDPVGDMDEAFATVTVIYPVDPDADGAIGDELAADAGPDQVVAPGETVTLMASLPGAAQATFAWKRVEGPRISIADMQGGELRFQAPNAAPGKPVRLVFNLTAETPAAQALPDSVLILVVPPNAAPIVQVVAQDGIPGAPVQLDGRGSRDPEASPLEFQWRQTEGPAVVLDKATGDLVGFVVPDAPAGTRLRFELTASDGERTGSAMATVVVLPGQYSIRAIYVEPIGPDGVVTVRSLVSGTSLRWTFDDGFVYFGGDAQRTLAPGPHHIELQVLDEGLVETYSVEVDVPVALASEVSEEATAAEGSKSSPMSGFLVVMACLAMAAVRRK